MFRPGVELCRTRIPHVVSPQERTSNRNTETHDPRPLVSLPSGAPGGRPVGSAAAPEHEGPLGTAVSRRASSELNSVPCKLS